ncbi:HTH-type sugar sensing transcriptional regulator TrmBL1 [Thermococcus gammatolerans]|uniref:Transcription regulator, TrmB-like protein (TrmB) n=1 Tax=Thermococcus gammatolerans (strain DSM 15229 / JCM 11827 / EJ3) TaxID=593117 RepID=C5A4D8_THEGJ|nr:TrmB family transcriptional regulator [Thermococcus gammatolerans]ACS33100.1 Transcription regulator, TrmB-like protein (TrmB) [Thermococcus gammatolerans EJ3]
MREEEIIEKLQRLGLTKYESVAYITLLKLGPSKATDITKESGIPHTRVYDVLSSLHRKGFVDVMQGTPRLYKPVNPEVILEKIKEEIIRDIDSLKGAFLELYREVHGEELPEIWTIQGFDNTVERAEYVIRSAKHEVLINTPLEFLELLKNEIKGRKDVIFVIISNFREVPDWLKGDNIILARSGGAPWLMASWIIGDIDYALFFGALPRDTRKEKFYSFWAKSPRIIQNYMHWFYTIYFDNSEIIKPPNYEKLPKPLSLVNIRTLIVLLKFAGLPRKAEIVGRIIDTKKPVTIDGEIIDYEYTPLTANVTFRHNGKELKVGGIGSYFEDVEGEKFILLE